MREAVCDTSPLQYLHLIGRLALLPQLCGTTLVPSAVVTELSDGRRLGCDLPDPATFAWCQIIRSESGGLGSWPRLGRGESEAIELAQQRHCAVLLDDLPARRVAESLGVHCIGTLGILLRAKQAGLIASLAVEMANLTRQGFRLDEATRGYVIHLAGE